MIITDEPLKRSLWLMDQSEPVLETTVGDALREAVRLAPQREALIEKVQPGQVSLTGVERTDRRWTYAQLLEDSIHCAHWLLARFVPGQHICVWAPNVPEWVVLQYGAALAGLVLVTANPALRQEELQYLLQRSRAVALFHTDRFRGTDMAGMAVAATTTSRDMSVISFTGWLKDVRATRAGGDLPAVTPRSAAQIQYTSGTTGNPKGALLHHMGLVTNARYIMRRSDQSECVFVSPMPLFHTAGSAMSVLGSVTTLSTLVLPLLFDPVLVLKAIEDERATRFGGVPTMLIAVLEQQRAKSHDISSLELVVSGGSPVPVALSRRVQKELGCDLVTVYGQTESSPIVCQTSPGDSPEDKARTVGQPLWSADVCIADMQTGEAVAIGEEGEIRVRGYQTMLEYFDDPEATARTLLADGWLCSGDLGTMDERGFCKVTGRLKDMIIRGGENLYPAEIEAVLMNHDKIADAAVFGVEDEFWGETVAVAVQLEPGAVPPTADELKTFCRKHLSPQKCPASWFVSEAFPLTGSGKVQKFRLREQAAAAALPSL